MRPQTISAVALSFALAAAQSLALGVTSARAQGANPSADQIIKSLTPTGDISTIMKSGGRGIRPSVPPSNERSADAKGKPTIVKVNAATAMVSGKKPVVDQSAEAAPTIDLTVNFATGSTELTPHAKETLNALGAALSSSTLASYRFRIEGHTDTVGTQEFNRTLSQHRAETVARYIAMTFGVAPYRMEPVGIGSDELLIATPEQVPEPRNRRVKIVNIGS